jgi:hypothetical protein
LNDLSYQHVKVSELSERRYTFYRDVYQASQAPVQISLINQGLYFRTIAFMQLTHFDARIFTPIVDFIHDSDPRCRNSFKKLGSIWTKILS